MREHLACDSEYSVAADGAGQEDDLIVLVIGGCGAARVQDKHRQVRLPRVQLGDEGRAADSSHVMSGDDQAELAGESGLLKLAKCLGSIIHPAHIVELPPQE